MQDNYYDTKIKNVSDADFAQAIQKEAAVSAKAAQKLVQIYRRLNDQQGEETLREVLDTLAVNEDIQVL